MRKPAKKYLQNPIKSGYSRATVQENISTLTREGYDPAQAVAIAMNSAREAYHTRYPMLMLPEHLALKHGESGKLETMHTNPIDPDKYVKQPKYVYVNENFDGKVLGYYGSLKMARDMGKVTRDYYRSVKILNPAYSVPFKKNPAPKFKGAQAATGQLKRELDAAMNLYRNFSGHEPELVGKTHKPKIPDVGIVIGELDGVAYETVRDGVKEKYFHQFDKKIRPLLVSSFDGSQVYILGGEYDFTADGIVDATDKKFSPRHK